MRNLFFIFTLFLIVSCGSKTDKPNHSIIGKEFQKFEHINALADYTKISDTSFYDNTFHEPMYGILHLQNQNHNLLLFKSIARDSINTITYTVLDTLEIKDLNTPEVISIGYCEFNEEQNINLISLVDKTDSLYIQNIKKVWQANTETHKIEPIIDFTGLNCINESYEVLDHPKLK
ncbi:hypothetical protein [Formosa sp. PL04]|uniref:hypothetical protein n=1 Tax=Formosa sp. PL04 TaxID=3081755 RepID=UPI002980F4ED|nr:hypothetical protein [Formosa sp. PL04]MDW5288203.1 hypothetical protein [Formosa sp. PL04]